MKYPNYQIQSFNNGISKLEDENKKMKGNNISLEMEDSSLYGAIDKVAEEKEKLTNSLND